jgi:hypothetical protein
MCRFAVLVSLCTELLRPAATLAQTPIPFGPLININFCAAKNPYGLSAVKTGFAAIGQTTNDYWNACSRDGATPFDFLSFVAVPNLTNADGTPSGAGLTLANAPGSWGNDVNDAMYYSYLYPFDGGNLTLTVTNLPPGTYDVCVYGHGSTQNGTHQNMNGVYQLSGGAIDYGTQSTATSGTNWATTNWHEGQQFVVFRNIYVTGPADALVVTGLPGVSGEALIAGVQIAPGGTFAPIPPIITTPPKS